MMQPIYTVIYAAKAARQLRKLPISASVRIMEACRGLALFPECAHVKALTQHRYGYRLRVGDYRVLFNVDGEVRIVSIEEVKKRDDHTY